MTKDFRLRSTASARPASSHPATINDRLKLTPPALTPVAAEEASAEPPKRERLFALDALRGLDMIFLCVVAPLVVTAARAFGFADVTMHPFMRQFEHYWGGFTAYDIIMPLFIFMAGAAVPFALGKRLDDEGRPTLAYWRHVIIRVILLWILGMMSQGRLLTYDCSKFCYFTNTLQSIAAGYFIAALVFPIRCRAFQVALPFVLAAVYACLLHFGGDYSQQGNLAMKVDMWFVNLFQPAGHDTHSYTWYLTTLMFGSMTLLGMNATFVLQSKWTPWRKAAVLLASGVALFATGSVLELVGIPRIKHLYTVSFTAQAMGLSVFFLAALYVLTDIWKLRRGWWFVTLYGQTALAAYLLGDIFTRIIWAPSEVFLGGLAKQVGKPWANVILQIGAIVALTLMLVVWRRARGRGKAAA